MRKKKSKKLQKEAEQESRLDYADIKEIVDYLVKTKAYKKTFDCYTEEDIAQEIRLICFKSLAHFEWDKVKKGKLTNFFGRCVDNALMNLKRDNYMRYTKSCNSDCEFLHGDENLNKDLTKICKKWIKNRKKMEKKKSIRHPVPMDVVTETLQTEDFDKIMEARDIQDHLLSQIDDDLRPYLIEILHGDRRDVPAKYRHKIQRFVKKILKE